MGVSEESKLKYSPSSLSVCKLLLGILQLFYFILFTFSSLLATIKLSCLHLPYVWFVFSLLWLGCKQKTVCYSCKDRFENFFYYYSKYVQRTLSLQFLHKTDYFLWSGTSIFLGLCRWEIAGFISFSSFKDVYVCVKLYKVEGNNWSASANLFLELVSHCSQYKTDEWSSNKTFQKMYLL